MSTSTESVDRHAFNGYDYYQCFSLRYTIYGAALSTLSSGVDAQPRRDRRHVG